MTKKEAAVVARILAGADGGACSACAGALMREFDRAYPGFGLQLDRAWDVAFESEEALGAGRWRDA